MTTETQVAVAGTPAPVESQTQNSEQNTPTVTATEGVVVEKQEEPARTFTQAEVDALVQKRLLKEERRINKRIEQRLAQAQQAQKLADEPKREQFRDDEAYINAQIEHLAEQKAAQKLAEREQRRTVEKQAETFSEKSEKAIEKYPDYDDAISVLVRLPIPDTGADIFSEFFADSDSGADVAYFLGKNPSKAVQIAQMTPVKAALALKGIEAELAEKPETTPKPSKAPAPIKPVGASSASTKNPAEMTDAEYLKWRKKGKA